MQKKVWQLSEEPSYTAQLNYSFL